MIIAFRPTRRFIQFVTEKTNLRTYFQMLIIFSFHNLALAVAFAYLGSCIHFYLIHIPLCNHIHTFHRVIHSTVDHMGSHDRNDLQI